jgi:hypothetical protein
MDSEDEAYDPWPGCTMDKTGCHSNSHYTVKYTMDEELSTFLKLDKAVEVTLSDLDDYIIDYAEAHCGIEKTSINYDFALWDLFVLDITKPFKLYQIEQNVRKLIHAVPVADRPEYLNH